MDDTTLFKAMQTQNLNCLAMFYKHVSIAIKDVAKKLMIGKRSTNQIRHGGKQNLKPTIHKE